MLALELNDARLILLQPAGEAEAETLAAAPGIACLGATGVVTGAEAAAQLKLQPQRCQQRYWQDLAAAPLGRAPLPEISAADLAFEQLQALLAGRREPLLIALPPGHDRAQLGLLLGIASEAGACEVGLVDAALAACALTPLPPHVLHLELTRHQAVLTAIEQSGDGARRARYELDLQCGVQRLEQLCIDSLAGQFVRQTRFDPLHHARTEQSLADGIGGWLGQLAETGSVAVSLPAGSDTLQVEFTRVQWLAAVEPVYAGLLRLVQRGRPAGRHVELRVGAQAQRFPGLVARLQTLAACEVVLLPEGAAALGALRHAGAILRGAEPALITRLPLPTRSAAPADAGALPAADARAVPMPDAATHIVLAGRAWALRGEPLLLGTQPPAGARAVELAAGLAGVSRVHCRVLSQDGAARVEDLSTYGTFVNEERVHGSAPLRRGDRLRLGSPGVTLDLIELCDG